MSRKLTHKNLKNIQDKIGAKGLVEVIDRFIAWDIDTIEAVHCEVTGDKSLPEELSIPEIVKAITPVLNVSVFGTENPQIPPEVEATPEGTTGMTH